jgi:hypothetical protein
VTSLARRFDNLDAYTATPARFSLRSTARNFIVGLPIS